MPRIRMDYRLRRRLAPKSKYRFCSEFDVIVEIESENTADALLAAAILLHEGGTSEPYRID